MLHQRPDRLLNGRGAGVFLDVFEQDLFQALRFVQEVGFAVGVSGYMVKIGAIDILAQTYR